MASTATFVNKGSPPMIFAKQHTYGPVTGYEAGIAPKGKTTSMYSKWEVMLSLKSETYT
jgi:hypothetical protein